MSATFTPTPSSRLITSVNTPWFLTLHAVERMREMDVDRSTVLGVLDYPEVDYVSQDRRVAKRGDLSVVYQPSNRVVITVLLNRTEQWDRTQDKVKTSA